MAMKIAHTGMEGFQEILERRAVELDRVLRKRDGIAIEKSADQMDEIQYASERDLAMRNVDRESSLENTKTGSTSTTAGRHTGYTKPNASPPFPCAEFKLGACASCKAGAHEFHPLKGVAFESNRAGALPREVAKEIAGGTGTTARVQEDSGG
jgi:hypothetical protein